MLVQENRSGRFRVVCAALVLLMAVAGIVSGGVGFCMRLALQAQSKAFVDGTMPTIVETWNIHQLLQHATPNVRDGLKPAVLTVLALQAEAIGPFSAYLGSTRDTSLPLFVGYGTAVSVSYTVRARYLEGVATFHITVIKRDSRWMIDEFHVDAQLLGPPGPAILDLLSAG